MGKLEWVRSDGDTQWEVRADEYDWIVRWFQRDNDAMHLCTLFHGRGNVQWRLPDTEDWRAWCERVHAALVGEV